MTHTRKGICFAYPTSPASCDLGAYDTGAWYVSLSVLREDGAYSPGFIEQGHNAFDSPDDPDLIALFNEIDGTVCPHFEQYGSASALKSLGLV